VDGRGPAGSALTDVALTGVALAGVGAGGCGAGAAGGGGAGAGGAAAVLVVLAAAGTGFFGYSGYVFVTERAGSGVRRAGWGPAVRGCPRGGIRRRGRRERGGERERSGEQVRGRRCGVRAGAGVPDRVAVRAPGVADRLRPTDPRLRRRARAPLGIRR
jgi:hypothetical protein